MSSDLFGIIDATVNYEKLGQLIIHRLPSAIQFGGRYRLIDFSLSNLKNSGIRNVAIFPNGNYRSLTDHVSSGKIWDLDRKRDGLFILPPKKMFEQSEEMISFRRMKEHMEYFLRTKQVYALITSGVIVWNIDFTKVLENHRKSGKDITELSANSKKLNTYLLSKDLLIDLILQHEYLGYHNLKEVIEISNKYSINHYCHNGYTKMITSIKNVYESHMDILNIEMGKTLFKEEAPILSKSKDAPPVSYGAKTQIGNVLIANGAKINGRIESSVVSRNVIIKEGTKINHSILMQESKVLSNAILDYCIIDKNAIIGENVVLKGTKENPIVIAKEEKIVHEPTLRVVHVATECAPFAKRGGLGDVVAALPKKERELGISIHVILPLYKQIDEEYREHLNLKKILNKDDFECKMYTYNQEGVCYCFLEINDFFNRDRLYDFSDDLMRYTFFNIAIIELINQQEIEADIIHLHDYHAALIPVLLKERYQNKKIKTCLTIHNIMYRGHFEDKNFVHHHLGDICEEDSIDFLKYGIMHASQITTVSPTYSKEIQYEYFSKGLTKLLNERKEDIKGILNGLDDAFYDPRIDKNLIVNYSIHTIEKKKSNKKYLQEKSLLTVDDSIPIIGMVTRLVEQKGLDLIIDRFHQLMEEDVQFVLLGAGDSKYEEAFQLYEKQYPKRVKSNIGYDSFDSHQIYAGVDMFLMPSRFEPCGLSQMIALKYGSVPIVRETGGLKDTVRPYNELTKRGNGFTFLNYNAEDMLHTIKRAIYFYHKEKDWKNIIINAMKSDFSYEKTAYQYKQLYEELLK